jgi:hypothetical protein
MDAFVVIFLAAFLLYCIPSIILTVRLARAKKPEKTCPPHSWTYKGHGEYTYMACSKCTMIPGMDPLEENDDR